MDVIKEKTQKPLHHCTSAIRGIEPTIGKVLTTTRNTDSHVIAIFTCRELLLIRKLLSAPFQKPVYIIATNITEI